jgi:phosphonate degradation associated HDIG domain protein
VTPHPAGSVDEVLDLYRRWGGHRYDEEVTQTDHALQCAALARADGAADALVASALLHDVGHLLHLDATGGHPGSFDTDRDHETVGATWLAALFDEVVTRPIRLHVAAKRYRSAVDPSYAAGLSAGSAASLVVQGGPMDADEAAAFRSSHGCGDAVRLRGWDDAGKVEGLELGDIEHFLPLLRTLSGR